MLCSGIGARMLLFLGIGDRILLFQELRLECCFFRN
jgi:hypothetical protein